MAKNNVLAQGKVEGEMQESAGKAEYDSAEITGTGNVSVNSGAAEQCVDCMTQYRCPSAVPSGTPMKKRPCYSKNCDGCANYVSMSEGSSKYAYSD